MVDSAFLEWDKACMFKYLQQSEAPANKADKVADMSAGNPALDTYNALLLGLSIIPTHSGVA